MPTNVLRQRARSRALTRDPEVGAAPRFALLTAGAVRVRIRVLATATADRIWAALPLRSTAERWGQELFFEVPVSSGRERGARSIMRPGDVAFVPDREVVAIAFGPTPASRDGEPRLWSPSNVWGEALDDVAALAAIQPGTQVGLDRVVSPDAEQP